MKLRRHRSEQHGVIDAWRGKMFVDGLGDLTKAAGLTLWTTTEETEKMERTLPARSFWKSSSQTESGSCEATHPGCGADLGLSREMAHIFRDSERFFPIFVPRVYLGGTVR